MTGNSESVSFQLYFALQGQIRICLLWGGSSHSSLWGGIIWAVLWSLQHLPVIPFSWWDPAFPWRALPSARMFQDECLQWFWFPMAGAVFDTLPAVSLPACPSPARSPHTCTAPDAAVPGTVKSLTQQFPHSMKPGLGGDEPGHVHSPRAAVLGAVVSHTPLCVWEQLEASGRVLHLGKALPGDAARYTCVATNAAGEAQQHTRLHVHGNAPKPGCPRSSGTWLSLLWLFSWLCASISQFPFSVPLRW